MYDPFPSQQELSPPKLRDNQKSGPFHERVSILFAGALGSRLRASGIFLRVPNEMVGNGVLGAG